MAARNSIPSSSTPSSLPPLSRGGVGTRRPWPSVAAHVLFTWLILTATALAAAPHPLYDDLGSINWRPNWGQAFQEAQASGRPIFIEISQEGNDVCKRSTTQVLTHASVRSLLGRNCICLAFELKSLPPPLEKLRKAKSLNTYPVLLFLTPQGEYLLARQGLLAPDDLAGEIKKVAADKRFATPKTKEAELNRQVQALEEALAAKDTRRIQSACQAIAKTPGLSPPRNKALDLLESAEQAARAKLDEASKLVRADQYPLARVALEEGLRLADSLPIAHEIQQCLAAMPLLESAADAENGKVGKWQVQAAGDYQQILQKYGDCPLATMAQLRLRNLLTSK